MVKGGGSRVTRWTSARFFHGGAPGLQLYELLLPADALGSSYSYSHAANVYDSGWVYVTSQFASARAYAARYLDPAGFSRPGDVYEVRALDQPQVDPDNDQFPEYFARCRRARIVGVPERGVVLTREEQVRLEAPFYVWGRREKPVFDEDGRMIPSDQMRANGVTSDWTQMLRPWLTPHDVDARGRLSAARRAGDPWRAFLELVPSLGYGHQIEISRRFLRRSTSLTCAQCDFRTSSIIDAAKHQLGEPEVLLLSRIHGLDGPSAVAELARAAATRDEGSWAWFMKLFASSSQDR